MRVAIPLASKILNQITAAAGTSLSLQMLLIKGLKFYSFQLQDMDAMDALYCYFLRKKLGLDLDEGVP